MENRELEKFRNAVNSTAIYTYRKLLHVDLQTDRCSVLKSDAGGWQPEDGPFSEQMESFARSGALHPEDVERMVEFIQPRRLLDDAGRQRGALTLLYRRRVEEGYRWNLMEVVPDRPGSPSAVLCVKDIHDALWEGVEREGVGVQSQELIRILGEQNFNIYMVDLTTGAADPIRVDGQMRRGVKPLALPWEQLIRLHILDYLQDGYREEFEQRFSLEGLRRARNEGVPKTELLCQRRCGDTYRYISVTAHFSRELKAGNYAVLALQDVDERMRRELTHTQRDAQMAAILKSRFKMMNSVDLETGVCQRIDLSRPAGPENALTGDYSHFIRTALERTVHPEDAEKYEHILSLDHLRETARTVVDFEEEVCLYRQRGEPEVWIELRVIYSRQNDHVLVNILGQDVTRAKTREAANLRALEERAYIISSLSSLFFSTYYIDLEHDTFRAVIQLRRVEDVLGEEVNCTAALKIYANHFIHPDDREEYLRVMNIQNLRETLRWWQPCTAVEYRKMPAPGGSEEDQWVRASAVLAQTGGDDMPKTVVYVAQDIGSRRRTDPDV